MNTYDDSTTKLFKALEGGYNFFRSELFDDSLKPIILVSNRHVRSMGYYRPHSWLVKTSIPNDILPEININPNILQLPSIEIYATLVHELCHHFQYLHGNPGRYGYHNLEFSRLMHSKGLMCSSTGMPGGKITGRRMSDYVIENGLFSQVFDQMPQEFLLPFASTEGIQLLPSHVDKELVNTKNRNKIKFTCPQCCANAWGKPELKIDCRDCHKQMK